MPEKEYQLRLRILELASILEGQEKFLKWQTSINQRRARNSEKPIEQERANEGEKTKNNERARTNE